MERLNVHIYSSAVTLKLSPRFLLLNPSFAHINPGRIAGILLQFLNDSSIALLLLPQAGKTVVNRFSELSR